MDGTKGRHTMDANDPSLDQSGSALTRTITDRPGRSTNPQKQGSLDD